MYKVTVDNQTAIEINPENIDWDLLQIRDGYFHIVKDHNSYTASVLEADYQTKSFKIRVGSDVYEVSAKDKFDLLAEKLGFNNLAALKINEIKAPMPGLVLDLLVEAGQTVAKGDSILILEAMKMENVIKALSDGTIGKIEVEKGQAVEKNQLLVSFD